jgi:hypothetical protein
MNALEVNKEQKMGKKGLKQKVRHFFARDFFRSPIVHWVLIGAIFVNLANWGGLAYFIRPVDFPITLHYNVYFGVDIIGNWQEAYFLPLIGTLIFIVNIWLAYFFYRQKERIAAYLLLLAAFIVQVGVSIAVIGIILINY